MGSAQDSLKRTVVCLYRLACKGSRSFSERVSDARIFSIKIMQVVDQYVIEPLLWNESGASQGVASSWFPGRSSQSKIAEGRAKRKNNGDLQLLALQPR